jgi:peptidylprolyl isomerase
LADPLPAGAPDVPIVPGPPPTELQVTDLTEGTGEPVPAGATVTVDYIGVACSTGKIFDASYGSQPATFPLSGVIPGWTEGIPGMKSGGKRLLVIPPAEGYGDSGAGSDIAPGETLWFVVEMRSFEPGTASSTP